MIFSEIIANWPDFAKLNAESILNSPGYSAKCQWDSQECSLTYGGIRPGIDLALRLKFGKHEALLGIPANGLSENLFPNLNMLLASKDLPETFLLAVLENDLAPLFQLLEEISEEHLQVLGIAQPNDSKFENAKVFRVKAQDEEILAFQLTLTPELVHAFGQLKHVNPTVPEIGDKAFPAYLLLAKFGLDKEDLVNLAQGDRILLPECPMDSTAWKVQVIVAGKFLVAANLEDDDVTLRSVPVIWQGDEELGVVAGEPIPVTLNELLGLLQQGATVNKTLTDAKHLRLYTLNNSIRKIAEGRLQPLGNENSFAVETIVK